MREKRRHKELGVVEGNQKSMANHVTCTVAKGQEQQATMRDVTIRDISERCGEGKWQTRARTSRSGAWRRWRQD